MAEVRRVKSITDFKVKEDTGDELIISFWGAKYDNIDSYKDVLLYGCAKKTLADRSERVAFCEQHNMSNPVGKFLVLEERAEGIWCEVKVSDAEPKIKTKIREGILKEFSIGYSEMQAEKGNKDGVDVNFVKEIKLYEISVVTVAANDQATLQHVKSEQQLEIYDRMLSELKSDDLKYEILKLKDALNIQESGEPLNDPEPQEPQIKTTKIKINDKWTLN